MNKQLLVRSSATRSIVQWPLPYRVDYRRTKNNQFSVCADVCAQKSNQLPCYWAFDNEPAGFCRLHSPTHPVQSHPVCATYLATPPTQLPERAQLLNNEDPSTRIALDNEPIQLATATAEIRNYNSIQFITISPTMAGYCRQEY